MANDTTIRERVRFLGQDRDKLRGVRGQGLYETLQGLGLGHAHYFRALGTTVEDYCAQEFGVDLGRVTVERFFQSDPNAKWLFPDLVRESVLAGMQRKPVFRELIIRDEPVTSTAFDVPYVEDAPEETEMRTVAEGAAIPESELRYGDRVVRLKKVGRGVIASYEVVRRMSVDMLRVHLQSMGEQLGLALDARLADVLIAGDSSGAGTAAAQINTVSAGSFAYQDLVRAYLGLSTVQHFTPTHFLLSPATAETVLQFEEIAASPRFDFAATGALPSPLGAKLVVMPGQPDEMITLLDAGYAVQKITEQDVLVESDKLINQQWDRTYLSLVTDFAVIYEKARVVLNNDWS
jgi:hypothetical protein